MPDDQDKPRGFSALIAPFFAEGATIMQEGNNMRITLPDGRFLSFQVAGLQFGNPNAEPLPPFDFRDQLKKDGDP